MINHVRCLLLNRSPAEVVPADLPGEAAVDPTYRPIALPGWLQTVRTALFGLDPDRLMLNYRLRQILEVLHATELSSFLSAADSRITYYPFQEATIYESVKGGRVLQKPESVEVFFNGTALTTTAQLRTRWSATVLGEIVILAREQPPTYESTTALAAQNGLSTEIPVPRVDLRLQLQGAQHADEILFEITATPDTDLGLAVARVRSCGDATLQQLFAGGDEPMQTYRNLWNSSRPFPYQVAALALALAHKTSEIGGI